MRDYSLNYFGGFPREVLGILQYMIEKWPIARLFSVDDLSSATGMQGRELAGPLSAFSKRSGEALIIKAGTTNKTVDNKRYRRPKQLWAINPSLNKKDLQDMRIKINQLMGLNGLAGISVIPSEWNVDESGMNNSDSGHDQSYTSGNTYY